LVQDGPASRVEDSPASFSFYLSLSLSLTHSLSLSLSLSLCLYIYTPFSTLSLYVSIFLSRSFFFSLHLFLSLSPSLSFSLYQFLSCFRILSLSSSLSFFFFPPFLSLYLSLCHALSISSFSPGRNRLGSVSQASLLEALAYKSRTTPQAV